jgi:hypothetical protein
MVALKGIANCSLQQLVQKRSRHATMAVSECKRLAFLCLVATDRQRAEVAMEAR